MKNQKGFTLIELLVVIAIISLLSSIVFASLSSARGKARDSSRKQQIGQINVAIQLYMEDHDNLPPNLGRDECVVLTNSDPSCYATSSNQKNWDQLAKELEPYISSIDGDPCPTCVAATFLFSKTAYAAEKFPYDFIYNAPAAVRSILESEGVDKETITEQLLSHPYQIYAKKLENESGNFGFGIGIGKGGMSIGGSY